METYFYMEIYSKRLKNVLINHWSECINIWQNITYGSVMGGGGVIFIGLYSKDSSSFKRSQLGQNWLT